MVKRFVTYLVFTCLVTTLHAQRLGILGAFGDEVSLLLSQLQQKKDTTIQKIPFTTGLLKDKPVVIAQTGVGKVNAAIITTLMIEHFKPTAIFFTGIAGGINPKLQPGDMVIGAKIAHHDYGMLGDSMKVWPTHNPILKKENPLYFLCDSTLVALALQQTKKIQFEKQGNRSPTVISGTIVSGDVFVASASAAQRLRTQLQADATEMEGAAVAQVCWQLGTRFIVIRSISDNANNKAHADAIASYKVAARNSASLVMAMVASF